MKRPATGLVTAFVGGLCLATLTEPSPAVLIIFLLSLVTGTLLTIRNHRSVWALLIMMFLLGFVRLLPAAYPPGFEWLTDRESVPAGIVEIEGKVRETRRLSGYATRIELLIQRITTPEGSVKTRLPVMLQVRDRQGITRQYQPGNLISLREYTLLHNLKDPQQEPYLKNWAYQGYAAVLETTAGDIHFVGRTGIIRSLAGKLRLHSEKIIDSLLPEPDNGLIKSLFFGNQGYLTSSMRAVFTVTGTAHIIAVSGLHVGILAMFVQLLFCGIGAGKQMSRLLTLVLVWFYAALAGFPVSIIRAATMYSAYVAAFFLERRYDAKSILLWSGMGFLWINPASFYTVSFQLSYSAVGALLWVYPRIRRLTPLQGIPGTDYLLITLSAQMGTWPIIAWHFGTLSLVSLPANLLIIPIIGILMPLAMVMTFMGFFSPALAQPLSWLVLGGTRYVLGVAGWFHRLPFGEIEISSVHPQWILLYYGLLTGMCVFCSRYSDRSSSLGTGEEMILHDDNGGQGKGKG